MEIIDQKILHDSVRWPLSPLYEVRILPGEITKEESAAGDIVIANEDGVKKIIKQSEYTTNSALYTEKGYEPIAVVVVPALHTDDGTARCMSLKFASYLDPNNGSDIEFSIAWGPVGSVTGLLEIDTFYYIVPGTSTTANTINLNSPSNNPGWLGGGPYAGSDPIATWCHATPAISPYGADGVSRNHEFFIEGGVPDYMDGLENTLKIVNYSTKPEDWETSPSIYNSSDYHIAALTCQRYCPIGTKPKDWYLPAPGEIFYITPRAAQILDGLELATNKSRTDASIPRNIVRFLYEVSNANGVLWSSGQIGGMYTLILVPNAGGFSITGKTAINYAIPFIKI